MPSIWGYVRNDLTYAPINGAIVSINSDFGDPAYNYTTGSDGYYQITALPYGTYNLYADKDVPPPPQNVAAPYYCSPKIIYSIAVVDNNPVYREILMRKK